MVSIENVQSFLDRGTYIGGAFIELKNTFDTASHHILLMKLEQYKDRGIINTWLMTYLQERRDCSSWNSLFQLETIHPVLEKFWPV